MYAKVFEQILDSSIAEDYEVRHVFEDLLKLATSEGIVDRTHDAIARRLNIPLNKIQRAISELERPDPKSRSSEHEGRRIIRLDEHRDWGWKIVNHGYYRALKTAEEKRAADALRQRNYRASKVLPDKNVTSVTESDKRDPLYMYNVSESEPEVGAGEKPKVTANSRPIDRANTIEALALEAERVFAPEIHHASALVKSNIHDIIAAGHQPDGIRKVFDWCRAGGKYKPKTAASLTDQSKFGGYAMQAKNPEETEPMGRRRRMRSP